MKIISWFFGIVLLIVATVYGVVFTPLGNKIMQPILQTEAQKATAIAIQVQTFELSFNKINLVIMLDDTNKLKINGTFSLLKQSFAIDYDVAFQQLDKLKKITKTQLNGAFFTQGKVVGDINKFEIDGKSDVAKSDTQYHVNVENLNPKSIIAQSKNLDLHTLLYMLNQKSYARGIVESHIDFKNITPHHLDGVVTLRTRNGELNKSVMKNDFGLTIPTTHFSMNLDAKLDGDDVDYKYRLQSNLANISSDGNVKPQPLAVDLRYGVDIAQLAVLKPLTHADIQGPLKLNGTLKGDKKDMIIDGMSDIAASKTQFHTQLVNLTPKNMVVHIKGMKLQKLLHMLKQPHYADALIDIDADITDAQMSSLAGVVRTQVKKGLLDVKYLTKAYQFQSPMPKTSFHLEAETKLHKNFVDTQLHLFSSLANLFNKKIQFNRKDGSLDSDYKVAIKDLNKFYFITQRHLKGSLHGYGKVKKGKDLDCTFHSDIAQGTLVAHLHNDDFHADLNHLKSIKLLDMLVYPKVFDAAIDGTIDYNLVHSQGKLLTKLSHGMFMKNQLLDLTKKYAHLDLYKEEFHGDLNADIDKEHIVSSLVLHSNKSAIITRNAQLNTLSKQIKATLDINANNHPLTVYVHGNIAQPKFRVKADALIEQQAKKLLDKELKKRYGTQSDAVVDEAKKKLQDKAKNLFKGLF